MNIKVNEALQNKYIDQSVQSTSIIVIGRYLKNPLNILKISDPVLNINGNSNEEM